MNRNQKFVAGAVIFTAMVLTAMAVIVGFAVYQAPAENPTTYTVQIPVDCPAEDDCLFQEGRVLQPNGEVHYVITVTRIEH